MSEKIKVWMVRPKNDPPYVACHSWEDVRHMVEANEEPGEEWLVKFYMMTQEEIDALPEFDGW